MFAWQDVVAVAITIRVLFWSYTSSVALFCLLPDLSNTVRKIHRTTVTSRYAASIGEMVMVTYILLL